MSKKTTDMSVKELLIVSRPFWWINTAAPFFVGVLTVQARAGWPLLLGTLYFAIFYNLFMYGVNDIYDYESDIRNPRKVGIDGSVLAKTKHGRLWFFILVSNIPFWLYFVVIGTLQSNVWLLIMIFMAFAYSIKGLRFKEKPFLDSFTSSFHYTSPFIFGILLVSGNNLWLPAYATFYIWVMSNHAFGAIQDIKPDREAGISSIATVLGASKTIVFCLAGYTIAALLPVIFYGKGGIVIGLLLLPYVYLVARTIPHRQNDSARVFRHSWDTFLYANYAVGFLLSMYFLTNI